MIKVIKKILFVMVFLFILFSLGTCTFKGCSRLITHNFKSLQKITLPPNQKLVTITWKGSYLWPLTRPMRQDEQAETYSFQEAPMSWTSDAMIIITETKE